MRTVTTAIFAAALAAPLLLGIGPANFVNPALAEDDDDTLYCWEWDDGTFECEAIGNLKAECELADPENTSDVCSDVNESRVIGRPGSLLPNGIFERGAVFTPAAGALFNFSGQSAPHGRSAR